MRLPNELSESVVPTFACVVDTNTGQERGFVDVPLNCLLEIAADFGEVTGLLYHHQLD